MWSRNHPACIQCGGTDRKHFGKGLCRRCYLEKYNADNLASVRALRTKWYKANVVGTDRQKIARDRRNFDGKRDAVLKRDGYKCQRCGSTKGPLTVHHKDRTGRNKSQHNNRMENLETLCRKCHVEEHRQELLAARALKKTSCKRGHPMTAEHGHRKYGAWRCETCIAMLRKQRKT